MVRLVNVLGVALHATGTSHISTALEGVLLRYVAVCSVLGTRLMNAVGTLLLRMHRVLTVDLHLKVELVQQLVLVVILGSWHFVRAVLEVPIVQTNVLNFDSRAVVDDTTLARASSFNGNPVFFVDHDHTLVPIVHRL